MHHPSYHQVTVNHLRPFLLLPLLLRLAPNPIHHITPLLLQKTDHLIPQMLIDMLIIVVPEGGFHCKRLNKIKVPLPLNFLDLFLDAAEFLAAGGEDVLEVELGEADGLCHFGEEVLYSAEDDETKEAAVGVIGLYEVNAGAKG